VAFAHAEEARQAGLRSAESRTPEAPPRRGSWPVSTLLDPSTAREWPFSETPWSIPASVLARHAVAVGVVRVRAEGRVGLDRAGGRARPGIAGPGVVIGPQAGPRPALAGSQALQDGPCRRS
jgi:hypothetical protein